MITRWLNQGTGHASGVPPATPILVIEIDYTYISGGWETVIYADVNTASGH
jgi:hypothetical protein